VLQFGRPVFDYLAESSQNALKVGVHNTGIGRERLWPPGFS